MPTSRSNISINRTLLILLGILLACILTINARTFYSAESLKLPSQNQPKIEKNASLALFKKAGKSVAAEISEKVPSLK